MKKQMLIIFLSVLMGSAYAQKFLDMMNNPNVNYYDVVDEANRYFETHDKGKGSGWKVFKRWEYEMQFQIDEKGNRLDGRQIWNETENFLSAHAATRSTTPVANWTELGPKSWSYTSGWNPGIGRITSIAVNPANQNVIYVGSPGGGVWKTTNGGSTWNVLTDNLTVLDIYSISLDPTNANIVYVGSKGGGILKSTNGGSSWVAATSGIPSSATVNRILIDPTNNSVVLAATSSGIYRSTNGGSSWGQVRSGSFNDLEFKPGSPSIVYASSTSFFRSTDNGVTWTQITNGISTTGRSFISVTPANSSYVYMVQAKGSEFGYLFRSTDSGVSFTTRVAGDPAQGTNYFGYSPQGTQAGGQAGYDMAMCVSSTNAQEVHIGGIITWKSTNGGSSFVATTEWSYPNSRGYTHCDMHALEYVGSNIYTGSDGGIYKSTDGAATFTDLSTGLGIRQFYRLGGSKTEPSRIAGGAQDNGSSILRNGTWIDWLGADGMETMIDHTNSNIIYGTSQNGTMYKSTNGGNSRTTLSGPGGSGAWVTPFMMHPTTATTVYVGYEDIYRSTSGGANGSWVKISNTGTTTKLVAMAIAPSNANYIYASKGSTLYVTKNGGSTWSTAASVSGTIQYITVHNSNPEKIAITTSSTLNNVYKSSNAGASWTNMKLNLPSLAGKCIVYMDGPEEGLFLGLVTGIYYIDNSLSQWAPFMDNLPKVQISEMEIHYSLKKIRVATYGRGMWESDLPCVVPRNLTVSNITSTSAKLNWDAQQGAQSFLTWWRPIGGAWSNTTVTTNSANATGLQANTNHEFTVGANCNYGLTAYSSPWKTFQTLPSCQVPSGLFVDNITSTSARLNWGAQDASSFLVWWRPIGGSWVSATVYSNSHNVTGLSSGVQYEFTVGAYCPSGLTAYASPYVRFTTSGSGMLVKNQHTSFDAGSGGPGQDIPILSITEPIPLVVFPNPANGAISIDFSLEENSQASVSIYDYLGKLVANIHSGYLPQGLHNYSFDISNFASGTYTVKMVSDNKTETVRMVKN